MGMKHVTSMLGGGAVVLAVLWLAGVPLATALPYALLLACPLMMIAMMRSMNGGNSHSSPGKRQDDAERAHEPDTRH